jgi:tetratricopeptide (TPR) repeat protein
VYRVLYQVMKAPPVPPRKLRPSVPADLERLALACMAKAPEDRPQTAAAVAEDCRRFLAGAPVQARPPGALREGARAARRRPALLAAAAVVVLSGGGAAWWLQAGAAERASAQAELGREAVVAQEADLASQVSQAFFLLEQQSGQAMRVLHDHWHGVPSDAAVVDDARAAVEAATGTAQRAHPGAASPAAWAALGAYYGGDAEALVRLGTLADGATADPFPAVMLGRAELSRFVRGFAVPASVLGSASSGVVQVEQPPEVRAALARAVAAFAAAESRARWADLRHGREWRAVARAARALEERQYDETVVALQGVREIPAVTATASQLCAIAAFATGAFGQAAAAGAPAVQRGWPVAMALRVQALLAQAGLDGERRVELLRAAASTLARYVEVAGADAMPHLLRGVVAKQLGPDFEGGEEAAMQLAETEFTRAIELEPAYQFAFYNRGLVRSRRATWAVRRGRPGTAEFRGALADLDRAIELNPGWALARVERAHVRRDMAKSPAHVAEAPSLLALAIADLDRAIDLQPGLWTPWDARGLVHFALGEQAAAAGDDPAPAWTLAQRDFDAAVERNPSDVSARSNRAQLHLAWAIRRLGAADTDPAPALAAARADLEAALAIEPDAGITRYHLARVEWVGSAVAGRGGQDPVPFLERAMAGMDRALEADPGMWQAMDALGQIALRLGRTARALEAFEAVVRMNPAQAPRFAPMIADLKRRLGR